MHFITAFNSHPTILLKKKKELVCANQIFWAVHTITPGINIHKKSHQTPLYLEEWCFSGKDGTNENVTSGFTV